MIASELEPEVEQRPDATRRFRYMRDLAESLGGIPADRIRLWPAPGTATEADLLTADAEDGPTCELVDGTLVDKPMGTPESRLAFELGVSIGIYLRSNDVGCATVGDGGLKLGILLVRKPDVAVIRWDRIPGGKMPKGAYPPVAPTIAVEVLSPSNTPKEMRRKRKEYFAAGTVEVWEVDVKRKTVRIYTDAENYTALLATDDLDGGAILPGFKQNIATWFDWTFRDEAG